MIVNVKKSDVVSLPIRATSKSAAYDVVAISEPTIVGEQYPDGGWKRVDYIQYDTGLITAPQNDNYGNSYHILIHPRSSVSKYNLLLANSIGLVDNDYRKSILVRFKYVWQPEDLTWVVSKDHSNSNNPYIPKMVGKVNMEKIYKKGDRIAQFMAEPTTDCEYVYVEDVDVTDRTGGFGSTDKTIRIKDPMLKGETLTIKGGIPAIINKEESKITYESKLDLLEQWKKFGGTNETPIGYESLIREREKNNQQ